MLPVMLQLPSTFLTGTSVAVKPPRQVGIPSVELDAQHEDLSCLGEEMVTLDGTTGKRSSAWQGLTNEELLPVLGPTTSLASFRTASTELYVPPSHSKGKSLQDGCVSSFKNDLQKSRQRSPIQKLGLCDRDKTVSQRRPESTKKNCKKRKGSQTELATADVEAAIGRVISAGEAIVVGHLIQSSSLSPGQERPIILEAALSLGKARHLCGLDKYRLDATTKDLGELETQDLDHESMQEAYADVGMILSVGTAVVNLSQEEKEEIEGHAGARCSRSCPTEVVGSLQRIDGTISDICKEITQDCKSVIDISHSSGCQTNIVAQQSEFGGLHSQRIGNNVQVHSFRLQAVKEPAGNSLRRASTIESRNPVNVDGLVLEEKVTKPSASWKSVAVVPSDSELKVGENVPGDHEIKIGNNLPKTEVQQEVYGAITESKAASVSTTEVMQCQQLCALLLSRTCHSLEGESSQGDGDTVKTTRTVPTQIKQITSWPGENSDKAVAQAPNADLVITDRSPNSEMFSGDFLLETGSMVESILHMAEHKEEFGGKDVLGMEIGVKDNKGIHSLESSEHHIELCLPSKAMASSETKWSRPDVGESPAILRGRSVENSTRNLVAPYVSRWFGGWSSNAAFNSTAVVATERSTDVERLSCRILSDIGSEDAVPEQKAFLARKKNIQVGQETTAFCTVSVDEAVVECFAQNEEATSEKPKNDSSLLNGSHSRDLDMSQLDPLCSFVPCSILAPAAVSLLPCHGDHRSSMLAATFEACVRTAMNIDSREVAHCLKAGGAIELESVPDPAVRTNNVASSKQILETKIDTFSLDDINVKRLPTLMKKLSTTTNPLSLLLHAVDIAGKSFPNDCTEEGGNLEQPSTRSPKVTSISPPLDFERMQGEVEQSADSDTQTTTDLPDVTLTANGTRVLKEKRISNIWMCADLSASPPLLWPGGKKRRLTACTVVDSDSSEWLHDYAKTTVAAFSAATHHMPHQDLVEKEQYPSQNVTRQSSRLVLGTATRSKPCHGSKPLFKGLQFLLTGFSFQDKEKLSKIVEKCGGELLADVPRFAPKQRFKRKGVDCGARSPPIVIAPQSMRTHKYLYGCAVGAPLLDASWINACVSAVKNLPYHQYQHTHTRAGCVSKSRESLLFVGFQFLFDGQQDFISQLSTLAKHAGGKVIRKLVYKESEQKQRQNLVGLVVVEGSSNLPLELQGVASRLEYHVVDSEWMIVSLLNGKLLPFPSNSTPPSYLLPSRQSSALKTGEPLQRYSRRRVQLQSENPESREDGDSGIELLVKKFKHRSRPDEIRPSQSSARARSLGKELEEQGHVNSCWLGKGFTSPLQVPQLTDRLLDPYSHSLAHRKTPKNFLCYEGCLFKGVEYVLGDIVEVRAPTADCPISVARIEGFWCQEDGRRRPQTRAFQQCVRKRAYNNVVLKCRKFYRPSETGFPGRQSSSSSTDEVYLSNNINDIPTSDVVRRVRVTLETADEVVHCRNWCDDVDDQERAAGSSLSHNKGIPTAGRAADYFCSFFYDHLRESLHRIKLEE